VGTTAGQLHLGLAAAVSVEKNTQMPAMSPTANADPIHFIDRFISFLLQE
jgi:hypothetical protein